MHVDGSVVLGAAGTATIVNVSLRSSLCCLGSRPCCPDHDPACQRLPFDTYLDLGISPTRPQHPFPTKELLLYDCVSRTRHATQGRATITVSIHMPTRTARSRSLCLPARTLLRVSSHSNPLSSSNPPAAARETPLVLIRHARDQSNATDRDTGCQDGAP